MLSRGFSTSSKLRRLGITRGVACIGVSLGLVPGNNIEALPERIASDTKNAALTAKDIYNGSSSDAVGSTACVGLQVVKVTKGDSLSQLEVDNIRGPYSAIVSSSTPSGFHFNDDGIEPIADMDKLAPGDSVFMPTMCGPVQGNEINPSP